MPTTMSITNWKIHIHAIHIHTMGDSKEKRKTMGKCKKNNC